MQGPMLSILAVFIILLIFGLGDMVATKTRAIVSMLFFSSVLFLAGFWTKVLPNTMFDDSTLLLVSGVLVSMLLVHMGTTIKLRDFADQWKTVLIAGIACIAISLGIYFIGGLIVADKNYVVVGAPILSGGVVATITMQTAVEGHSVELGVFAALVMVVQGFVGYPVCSLCLKSEAKRVRSLVESGQALKGVTAKIVTAAAAMEKWPDTWSTMTYTCSGSENMGGSDITCLNGTAHGEQDIFAAMGNSCNVWFAHLAEEIGAEALQAKAEEMGFGDSFRLGSVSTEKARSTCPPPT